MKQMFVVIAILLLAQLLVQEAKADVSNGFVINTATKECIDKSTTWDENGVFYAPPEGCVHYRDVDFHRGSETYNYNSEEMCRYYGFTYGLNESECYKGEEVYLELTPHKIKDTNLKIIISVIAFLSLVVFSAVIFLKKKKKQS